MQVKLFKDKIMDIIRKIEDDNGETEKDEKVDESLVSKLFEEIKLMFQELPTRIEGRISRNELSPKIESIYEYIHVRLSQTIHYLEENSKILNKLDEKMTFLEKKIESKSD